MRFVNALSITSTTSVAIEGCPIYLCDQPVPIHGHCEQVIDRIVRALQPMGAAVTHYVLLDEHTCQEAEGMRELYLVMQSRPNTQIVLESEMVVPARELFACMPRKQYDSGGLQGNLRRLRAQPKPLIMTDSNMPTCALLDSAFQYSKQCDLNIIVHPTSMMIGGEEVSFREQQAGVVAVLKALRVGDIKHSRLPWVKGLVHVWVEPGGKIESITWTRNKGRGIRGSRLPIG